MKQKVEVSPGRYCYTGPGCNRHASFWNKALEEELHKAEKAVKTATTPAEQFQARAALENARADYDVTEEGYRKLTELYNTKKVPSVIGRYLTAKMKRSLNGLPTETVETSTIPVSEPKRTSHSFSPAPAPKAHNADTTLQLELLAEIRAAKNAVYTGRVGAEERLEAAESALFEHRAAR